MTDPSGGTVSRYERRGLLRSEQRTSSGATYTTTFGYDENGHRSSITYPSGRVVTYAYDFAGRPLSATSANSTIVSSAEYLPFGPMTKLVFGNGTTKTMSYDSRYLPSENKLTTSSATLADYTYAHDAAGNITQIHDATSAGWNRDFAYDDLNRLVTANSGSSLWGTGSYTYDAMGNMTSLQLGTGRQASFTYSGTTPKLSSVTENSISRTVSYDTAGNETAVGGVASAISARNLVAGVGNAEYEYDGRGVRTVSTPPLILSFASTHLTATKSVQGTITLPQPALSGGYVVTLSAAAPLTVPATVTVSAGSSTATFTASAADVLSGTTVTVTATHAEVTAQATLIVDRVPWYLVSLTIDPTSLCPETPTGTGTVVLEAAAPTGGAAVQLTWVTPRSTYSDSVVVAAGQTSASFTTTNILPTYSCIGPCTGTVSITAQLGAVDTDSYATSEGECSIGIEMTLPKGPMTSSREAFGELTLREPAGPNGVAVLLCAPGSRALQLPSRVHIAAGERTAHFRINTGRIVVAETVTVEASLGGRTRRRTLQLAPTIIERLELPAEVMAGTDVEGRITLADEAPAGGSVVTLGSSSAMAEMAANTSIKAGSSSGSFLWHVPMTASGTMDVMATLGASRVTTQVTVHPVASTLRTVELIDGVDGLTGVVTLAVPAPSGGVVVILSSDDAAVSIPASVLIAEGTTAITFEVGLLSSAPSVRSITIGATVNNVTLKATHRYQPRTLVPRVHGMDWLQRPGHAVDVPIALGVTASFASPATNTITGDRRISLYTPELQLLAETAASSSTTPALAYEYVWFGGLPVAQIEAATNARHYYFTDHLGTPVLTTNAAAAIDWRVEREPFGSVYHVRIGRYQPLAFPGQEEDATSDRSYNVFRWYRAGWGRYTQADPIGLAGGINPMQYVFGNPISSLDPFGLVRAHYQVVRSDVSYEDMYTLTKGPDNLGVTFFQGPFDCPCSPACDIRTRSLVYTMEVTIDLVVSVWVLKGGGRYSDNPFSPWASANEIFFEEMKHVMGFQRLFREVVRKAESLENTQFASRADCEGACAMLKSNFVSAWEADIQRVHSENPHGTGRGWR